MLYIFDTDHLTLNQRGDLVVAGRIQRFNYSKDRLLTTIVNLQEQFSGRFQQIQRAKNPTALIQAYQLFSRTVDYFRPWQVLDYDDRAELQFQAARKSGVRIGTMDLRIAAIALSLDATVVTRNQKDFQQVPNLKFEDWSV
ncbi:MAG: type II toxin-antitoxin system VapC family toxin [Alkalinema sp. RU_4_3]|nr:type II toxin-antitoxin system VapC family toxin [Alkalinema sp. RU_4_3]